MTLNCIQINESVNSFPDKRQIKADNFKKTAASPPTSPGCGAN